MNAAKVLILHNLGCANCAAKIEAEVGNIPGVTRASVNFMAQKLLIELEAGYNPSPILKKAEAIAQNIEPDIIVTIPEKGGLDEETPEQPGLDKPYLLIAGAVLFAVGLASDFSFWTELALFLTSYLLVGHEVLLKAGRNIFRGQIFDENFLISLSTIGAFAIKQFPEGVAVMLFYQVGEFLQDLAVHRSRKSISSLMDIRPESAHLKIGDEVTIVAPWEVNPGDLILVKPGERVPLDGIVIDGQSTLDTSALTGEPVPRKVETGEEVLSGFININGLLTVKVNKGFQESTVAKILDLVENASSKKAPTENFITKFARYYTPAVVFIALAIAIFPPLLVSGADLFDWVYRALVFLVISCPCALVVSIPVGFFGGIGGASRKGILVKGGNYLEALNNVDTVVFDKTGTLTKGVFKVTKIITTGSLNEEQLLKYASLAESHSNHPIAVSIKEAYGKEADYSQIEDYVEIPGHGIKITAKNMEILAGNSGLLQKEAINFTPAEETGTVVYLAVNREYCGYLVISDEMKEDSQQAVRELKQLGVRRLVMLTGDTRFAAANISQHLDINEFRAELLPHQKVAEVEALTNQKPPGKNLVFVGDGINDAPVLARADIGIAMGGLGSDAAIEAADVVLMTDEPSRLASAIKIARRTRRIVWQNIIFALGVKGVVLALGALGMATMWQAVFADVGVAVLAVLNAMRAMQVDSI